MIQKQIPVPRRPETESIGVPFDRLAADESLVLGWQALDTMAATLPTQGYAFAAALSRSMLAEASVEVLLVLTAMGIGGLLPLCRRPGYFARWRMIGALEVFEPGDALCDGDTAAGALAREVVRRRRPLRLDRLPAGSRMIPALRAALRGKGLVSVRPAVPCPKITLDEAWREPESRFNSGRRSDFRRAARKAESFGAIDCQVLSPAPHQFDALFDEAIGVELQSWKKEAGSALGADRAKEAFFRDYFRAASRDGTFRIAFLRIDGKAVAMQMAIEKSGRYWLFKIGYDESFGKCSPGTLLMLHTLGWAAQRGLQSYELLGNVERWIADFWTREQNDCVQLRTYPFNLRGLGALVADGACWLRARLAKGR